MWLCWRLCFIKLVSTTEQMCTKKWPQDSSTRSNELNSPKNKTDLVLIYTIWPFSVEMECSWGLSSKAMFSGSYCTVQHLSLELKADWMTLGKLMWLFGLSGPCASKDLHRSLPSASCMCDLTSLCCLCLLGVDTETSAYSEMFFKPI